MDFEQIKNFAVASGMDGANFLQETPGAADICNGIGAAYFPAGLRKLLDEYNPAIQAPAAIHDLDYSFGGTSGDRRKADWKFLKNCFRSGNYLYKAVDPRRYLVWGRAMKFFCLLRIGGSAAFNYHKEENL